MQKQWEEIHVDSKTLDFEEVEHSLPLKLDLTKINKFEWQ
jgi:hypothetical protein